MNNDILHRYIFDNADVRGEIVQLESSYQEKMDLFIFLLRMWLKILVL